MANAEQPGKSTTRANNIELLRIIAMLMIVSHHYMYHGGGLTQNAAFSLNWFFSWIVEALSVVAVNCYVLISGYFLISSKFKLKKLVQLWGQVLFYSICVYLVLLGIGLQPFSLKHLLGSFLPVLTNKYWFATVYIALYILSPFLNTAIHALSRRQMQNLLVIMFFMFSLWPTVIPFGLSLDRTNGYSIIHFIFLYITASYIRLYWDREVKKSYYIGAYILISALMFASKVSLTSLGFNNLSYVFFEYNSVTVILSSLMLFMFFRNVSVKSALLNRVVASVSILTFGVYLIHDNIFVRGILYNKILHTDLFWNTPLFIPVATGTVLGIFAVCLLIDAIRRKVFMFFENSKFSNIIYEKIVMPFSSASK